MWRSIFTNKQTVLLQCLGKVSYVLSEMFIFSFIIEKIATLSFVLSLYHKNRFISTIYFYIICLVLYSWNLFVFTIAGEKFFFLHSWSNNQLSCSIVWKIFTMRVGDYEQIINYDWPYLHTFYKPNNIKIKPSTKVKIYIQI